MKDKGDILAENQPSGDRIENIPIGENEEDIEETDSLTSLEKMVQNLPEKVKRRIKALKKIQYNCLNLELKFYEEVHKLELKYHKQYTPFYEKRGSIVCGDYEPKDEECDWPSDEENLDEEVLKKNKINLEKEKEVIRDEVPNTEVPNTEVPNTEVPKKEVDVKGIPEFWLTILKNVGTLSEMVQEHDEVILKHLIDITVSFQECPMGFTLEFHFSPNEYFTNTILTKEYAMKLAPDPDDPFAFEGPEIFKSKGCNIEWNEGKNVTLKTVRKRKKHKTRGVVRTVHKTIQNDSFFNFFSPPPIPEDGTELDDETYELLTSDFEIGHYLRERIIPRAVLYYTGEGLSDEEYEESEESDDEDEVEYETN